MFIWRKHLERRCLQPQQNSMVVGCHTSECHTHKHWKLPLPKNVIFRITQPATIGTTVHMHGWRQNSWGRRNECQGIIFLQLLEKYAEICFHLWQTSEGHLTMIALETRKNNLLILFVFFQFCETKKSHGRFELDPQSRSNRCVWWMPMTDESTPKVEKVRAEPGSFCSPAKTTRCLTCELNKV